ncbi:phosphatidate cytidylyltransferase [Conchiformibius steedae]|uniref:phosphatidate cytidylyltransferase n=1 Tax=Conchiformibius steedae TaxID=153493 RepID=UPI0026ED445D|nr:phosphatidate cytidylyltransferase [Conchiformibius steedae]
MESIHQALPIQAGFVFLGIFAVLLAATGIGAVLKKRLPDNRAVDDLNARVSAWWIIMVVLLFAFWFHIIGTTFLFFLISFAALREFMTLVYRRRSDHNAIAACFYILLPLQYYFVLIDWYGMFAALIPVYAFLLLPVIAAFSGNTACLFERAAQIQWGAMITIFCLSHVPAIMMLNIQDFEERNILLLIFMIVVVQAGEVLQYVLQTLFGGKKIMPALSSESTILGTLGGFAGATALAAGLYRITPFTPWEAAAIGLVISVMGFFGTLVMAGIKRSHGVQHWGHAARMRGGMLDRVDSICFAAPVFFHLVRYYWA